MIHCSTAWSQFTRRRRRSLPHPRALAPPPLRAPFPSPRSSTGGRGRGLAPRHHTALHRVEHHLLLGAERLRQQLAQPASSIAVAVFRARSVPHPSWISRTSLATSRGCDGPRSPGPARRGARGQGRSGVSGIGPHRHLVGESRQDAALDRFVGPGISFEIEFSSFAMRRNCSYIWPASRARPR